MTQQGKALLASDGRTEAKNLTDNPIELYNSNKETGARDRFAGNKFIAPVIANGKVFVGTPNSVAVFGLL